MRVPCRVGIALGILNGEGKRTREGRGHGFAQRGNQPMRVGSGDGLVPDGAEVACGVKHQRLQRRIGVPCGNHVGGGEIGSFAVPGDQRVDERRFGAN